MRLYKTIAQTGQPVIVDLVRQYDLATGEPDVILETELFSADGKIIPAGSPNSWRPSDPDYPALQAVLTRAEKGQPSELMLGGVHLYYESWDPAWQHHAPESPIPTWYVIEDFGGSTMIAGPHGFTLRQPRYAVWRVREGVLEAAVETGDDLDWFRRSHDIHDAVLSMTDTDHHGQTAIRPSDPGASRPT